MDQDNSLLREALESANLSSSVAADEFWGKRLGKNARTKAVRSGTSGTAYVRLSTRTSSFTRRCLVPAWATTR